MGTLTAGQPRLAEYCAHKLPTSCRLSSIPECCACADERAHAAAYRTYIDGEGYVLRGSRWDRYCWFCREYWNNRVRASGLPPAQTRIPEDPDQTAFLDRWYEFHQGYRSVLKDDGTEERVAVVGEDFRNVSPGCMPRTLEELRQGRETSTFDVPADTILPTFAVLSNGPSLDDELDQLIESATAEQVLEQGRPSEPNSVNDVLSNRSSEQVAREHNLRNNEYHTRRIAALRRELQRMRNGIERVITGLRELGENVPDHRDATGRLEILGQTLDDITRAPAQQLQLPQNSVESGTTATARDTASMQTRLDEARRVVADARRMRDQAATELESAEQEVQSSLTSLQQLQREQRTMENYTRIFGTREDIIAQGDAYESPIGGMFNRAWERFRAAEETRQEERTLRRLLDQENAFSDEANMRRMQELERMDGDVWGAPLSQNSTDGDIRGIAHQGTSNTTQLMEMARDEVFAGQSSHSQDSTSGAEGVSPVENMIVEFGPRRATSVIRYRPSLRVPDLAAMADTHIPAGTVLTGPYELTPTNWRLDAEFLLTMIARQGLSSAYTRSIHLTDHRAQTMLDRPVDNVGIMISEQHRDTIDALFADDEIVWNAGLPAEWFRRARQQNRPLWFSLNPASDGREEQRQNIEAMAEAFMMSGSVRRQSTLSIPEQMGMRDRLQRGQRSADDRRILWLMLNMRDALEAARPIAYEHAIGPSNPEWAERLLALNMQRQEAARAQDTSRASLNVQRQEARSIALAAGHMALQAGASGVMERMADMELELRNGPNGPILDETWHSIYGRYRAATREQQEQNGADGGHEAVGLDAEDDRPEPKEEGDMTVNLECRICYSQLAEIACLPCGHLVMCKWCSDQHSPTMKHDNTRPRLPATCPICRKGIRQKVRVFRA